MSSSDPLPTRFAADLQETLKTGDSARLAEYLSGRHLPALGNDLTPADVILRAIEPDPGVTARLAGLLAEVLGEESARLRGNQNLDVRSRFRLRNIYALAADLPAQAKLFFALRHHYVLVGELKQLWSTALAYQQTDNSLEHSWLAALTAPDEEVVIIGWRGLLWIPPRKRLSDVIINVDRLEKGLLVLHDSVKDRENGSDLLRYALEILGETYPRSSRFWEASLGPRVGNWPEVLQQEVFRRWPLLRQSAKRSRLLAG